MFTEGTCSTDFYIFLTVNKSQEMIKTSKEGIFNYNPAG